ncbi:MAG: glycosyltransferase family 2 protein [Phycisphaeraceae bacterium]
MDLSIVIVNWNTRELLAACLASLPEAVRPYQTEVWVVDNGSTDASAAMVRERFPQAYVIANQGNHGFARANNQAMAQAAGRYWLLLNSDTVAPPGSLARLVQTLDEDVRIGIAGAQLLNEDGSAQNSIAPTPSLLTELGNKGLLRLVAPHRYATRLPHADGPVDVDSVIGACMMVRAAMAKEIGLLDEGYFFFLEETDWCVRAHAGGWRVVCDPRARVYHLQGRSAGKARAEARIEYWRSRYRFFSRHRSGPSNVVLRVGLLAKLAGSIAVNALAAPTSPRHRQRLGIYRKIARWHRAGRPADWGLAIPPSQRDNRDEHG